MTRFTGSIPPLLASGGAAGSYFAFVDFQVVRRAASDPLCILIRCLTRARTAPSRPEDSVLGERRVSAITASQIRGKRGRPRRQVACEISTCPPAVEGLEAHRAAERLRRSVVPKGGLARAPLRRFHS
jgi:hypothetical protein